VARAIWSGWLSFGLVNIPVKLYPATAPKDVRFHQFQAGTGRRVRYQRVPDLGFSPHFEEREPGQEVIAAPAAQAEPPPGAPGGTETPTGALRGDGQPPGPEAAPIPYEDVVKGYEVAPDRYVMVTPQELAALRLEADRIIAIEEFVDLPEIDPIYFEKSYYVAPDRGPGAGRPYGLLLRALEAAGKVGIGRFVLRTKEYLTAVRPMKDILVLETLFFADEVRAISEIAVPPAEDVSERELEMAGSLIGMLATDWDPARHQDTYRQRVLQLLEQRAGQGGLLVEEQEGPASSKIPDLMAALRASVEAAQKEKSGDSPKRAKGRRTG
jgi:DNA end-binding protein Ku